MNRSLLILGVAVFLLAATPAQAQIGRRFPSEKKIVPDPVTGVPLEFLTSTEGGDSKIYQTHHQWTSDGKWVIFRSNRAQGNAMAVNEETGEMVQVSQDGYFGMLCVADHSMNLYFLRRGQAPAREGGPEASPAPTPAPATDDATTSAGARGGRRGGRGGGGRGGPVQVIRVDLAKLFADSAAGTLKASTEYEHVCGTCPADMAGEDMALDPTEDYAYFRFRGPVAAAHLPSDQKPAEAFGTRGMGAGPAALASMNLHTGETKFICSVPFQIGHVQTNPWMPGEIVFCWETGGKAPQRTWTVMADGTGLRPLYPEAPYEWITHEAVITKDEVAIAMLYLRTPLGGPRGGRRGGAANGAAPADSAAPANGAAPATGTAPATGAAPANGAAPATGAAPANGRGGGARGARGGRRGGGNAAPVAIPPEQQAILDETGKDGHPTGVGIVNLRTREMRIVGQVPIGDPGRSIWHVNGSPDGRWAVADDFQFRLWIIDRKSGEMKLLADLGHVTTAQDHVHPTFNADSNKVEIQTAMLSENGTSLNICVVPVPKSWLDRTYPDKFE